MFHPEGCLNWGCDVYPSYRSEAVVEKTQPRVKDSYEEAQAKQYFIDIGPMYFDKNGWWSCSSTQNLAFIPQAKLRNVTTTTPIEIPYGSRATGH